MEATNESDHRPDSSQIRTENGQGVIIVEKSAEILSELAAQKLIPASTITTQNIQSLFD